MPRREPWGLLLGLARTDVLVWPLTSVSDAIYNLRDWESSWEALWAMTETWNAAVELFVFTWMLFFFPTVMNE